jgi:hypothetical protein
VISATVRLFSATAGSAVSGFIAAAAINNAAALLAAALLTGPIFIDAIVAHDDFGSQER